MIRKWKFLQENHAKNSLSVFLYFYFSSGGAWAPNFGGECAQKIEFLHFQPLGKDEKKEHFFVFFLPRTQLDFCWNIWRPKMLFFSIFFHSPFIFLKSFGCFFCILTPFQRKNFPLFKNQSSQSPLIHQDSPSLGSFLGFGWKNSDFYLTQVPGLGSSLGLGLWVRISGLHPQFHVGWTQFFGFSVVKFGENSGFFGCCCLWDGKFLGVFKKKKKVGLEDFMHLTKKRTTKKVCDKLMGKKWN